MRRLSTQADRIDWFQVLTDLARAGVPVSAVAPAIRVPKSTILGWKQGAEPKFTDGERLVALWLGITARTVEQLPRQLPPGK